MKFIFDRSFKLTFLKRHQIAKSLSELQRLGDAADVVIVSTNYRLGPLGFMCLASVASKVQNENIMTKSSNKK